MTKCIAKTESTKKDDGLPSVHMTNFSNGEITVTLDDIRRDSKTDYRCFHFKIAVSGKDAGEFTILEGSDFKKIPYQGNIGAEVSPEFSGQGLSEKVLNMLLPFCKERGLSKLLITTDPNNEATKKICSNISAKFLDTLPANQDYPEKSRYVLKGINGDIFYKKIYV